MMNLDVLVEVIIIGLLMIVKFFQKVSQIRIPSDIITGIILGFFFFEAFYTFVFFFQEPEICIPLDNSSFFSTSSNSKLVLATVLCIKTRLRSLQLHCNRLLSPFYWHPTLNSYLHSLK